VGYFSVVSYRNAALYWDPNGTMAQNLGPRVNKWIIGNAFESLTISSNLGFPRVSPYCNFTSPNRFPTSPPTAIIVFPVRVAKRYGFIANSGLYNTGT
jgi:hypothetical protein